MIYLGADHRGFELKEKIKTILTELKFAFEDLGAFELNPEDDFNEFAEKVAGQVLANPDENKGILICGSGAGVDIVANKFKGVRSVLGFNAEQVRVARNDDDVNILSLAADFMDEQGLANIIELFLNTPFEKTEKQIRRIEAIKKIER